MEDEKQEGVEMNDEQNKDIDQQRITKYKEEPNTAKECNN